MVGRGMLPPLFYEDLLFAVSMAEWVITPHSMCYFNDIMDLHMSSHGTLAPEGPWCVFYATGHKVYWGVTQCGFFCSYSDLVSQTQTQRHTQHTQGPVDWHVHENIYLHHLLCAHKHYFYYIKWLNE